MQLYLGRLLHINGLVVSADNVLLSLNLLHTLLKVVCLKVVTLHARHKQWSISEQVVHLLQRTLSSFGHERPEEECVGEVANDEAEVLSV